MKKNSITYIALFSAFSVLQSCSVQKNNKQADLALDNLNQEYFTSDNQLEQDPISYDSFFKDQQLIDWIKDVLLNNNDLISATKQLQANEAVLKATKLNYLPDVNLQVSSSVQRLSKNSMMGGFAENLTYQDYTIAPNVSWEIDLWGKLKGQRQEANALFLAQTENIRAIKLQLITQTASVYYNLVFLKNQQEEVKKLKDLATNSVQLIEKQYQYGDASIVAIKQAKDQIFELGKIDSEIKQSIKQQEVMLATLSGKYPEDIVTNFPKLKDSLAFDSIGKVNTNQLKNRPDVKRAELELVAANARVGINNAALYPSLVISAQGGLNSITAGNIFNVPASLFGNLAGGLTQPLFNKRQLKSNYEQAVFLRDAKIADFKQEMVKSVAEVTDALNNISALKEQNLIAKNKINNLENAIVDAQLLYKYGEITYLEVLAVQQLQIQAQLAYLQLNRNNIEANILLFKAIGG